MTHIAENIEKRLWFYTARFTSIRSCLLFDGHWDVAMWCGLHLNALIFPKQLAQQSLNDAHVPSATSVRNLIQKNKHKMQDCVTKPATDQNCCVVVVCSAKADFSLRYCKRREVNPKRIICEFSFLFWFNGFQFLSAFCIYFDTLEIWVMTIKEMFRDVFAFCVLLMWNWTGVARVMNNVSWKLFIHSWDPRWISNFTVSNIPKCLTDDSYLFITIQNYTHSQIHKKTSNAICLYKNFTRVKVATPQWNNTS